MTKGSGALVLRGNFFLASPKKSSFHRPWILYYFSNSRALCKVEPTYCWVGLDSRFPDKILRNCYTEPLPNMKAPGCKNETHFDLTTQGFLESTDCYCREDLCNTDNSFNFPYFK